MPLCHARAIGGVDGSSLRRKPIAAANRWNFANTALTRRLRRWPSCSRLLQRGRSRRRQLRMHTTPGPPSSKSDLPAVLQRGYCSKIKPIAAVHGGFPLGAFAAMGRGPSRCRCRPFRIFRRTIPFWSQYSLDREPLALAGCFEKSSMPPCCLQKRLRLSGSPHRIDVDAPGWGYNLKWTLCCSTMARKLPAGSASRCTHWQATLLLQRMICAMLSTFFQRQVLLPGAGSEPARGFHHLVVIC